MAIAALRDHAKASVWVFGTSVGTPMNPSNVKRDYLAVFERIRKADPDNALPRIRFHDLRHTAATLLLASGVHPKVVAEMLGHSSVRVTLDVYSHVTEPMQHQAATAIDGILDPQPALKVKLLPPTPTLVSRSVVGQGGRNATYTKAPRSLTGRGFESGDAEGARTLDLLRDRQAL